MSQESSSSRRSFLKTSAAAASGALAAKLSIARSANVAGSDRCVSASSCGRPGNRAALGPGCRQEFQASRRPMPRRPPRVKPRPVLKARARQSGRPCRFVGFDAQQRIDSASTFLLPEPPHSPPPSGCCRLARRLCRQPVAVDAPGVRWFWPHARRHAKEPRSGLCAVLNGFRDHGGFGNSGDPRWKRGTSAARSG